MERQGVFGNWREGRKLFLLESFDLRLRVLSIELGEFRDQGLDYHSVDMREVFLELFRGVEEELEEK